MSYRPTTDYNGGNFAPTIDRLLGAAFWTVKKVADAIDDVTIVAANITAIVTAAQQYSTYTNLLKTQPNLEALSVNGTNSVTGLTYTYDGGWAIVFVNGQAFPSNTQNPAFTISGKVVTWNPANANGLQLTQGVTDVSVWYTTAAAPVVSNSIAGNTLSQTQLLLVLQSLPTTQPAQSGVLWLNGGVPCISP